MTVNPLSSNLLNLLGNEAVRNDTSETGAEYSGSFADVLTESFSTADETDTADKTSAIELLTGQSDDLSGVLLDATKAELSLRLALQIKNKIVDAYNEITRMQI